MLVVHCVLRAFLVLFSHLLDYPLPGVRDSGVHGLPGHIEGAEAGEGVAVDDEAGGGGPHLDTGQVPATSLAGQHLLWGGGEHLPGQQVQVAWLGQPPVLLLLRHISWNTRN